MGLYPKQPEVKIVEKVVYRERMVSTPNTSNAENLLWGLGGAALGLFLASLGSDDKKGK